MANHTGDTRMGISGSGRYPVKARAAFSTSVAILCGLIVLGGYFVQLDLLVTASRTLVEWAVLLSAFAVLLGIMNLLFVHSRKIFKKEKGAFYSILLAISLVITFLLGVFSPSFSSITNLFEFTFRAIQFPVEASLMALLPVTLTYGCIRLLRDRASVFSIVLLVTTLLILLGMVSLPLIGSIPLVSDTVRPFVTRVLAGSGARGILIGVALGALVTGLRVLLGFDRPYEGK